MCLDLRGDLAKIATFAAADNQSLDMLTCAFMQPSELCLQLIQILSCRVKFRRGSDHGAEFFHESLLKDDVLVAGTIENTRTVAGEDPGGKSRVERPNMWHQKSSCSSSSDQCLNEEHLSLRDEGNGHRQPVLKNACDIVTSDDMGLVGRGHSAFLEISICFAKEDGRILKAW